MHTQTHTRAYIHTHCSDRHSHTLLHTHTHTGHLFLSDSSWSHVKLMQKKNHQRMKAVSQWNVFTGLGGKKTLTNMWSWEERRCKNLLLCVCLFVCLTSLHCCSLSELLEASPGVCLISGGFQWTSDNQRVHPHQVLWVREWMNEADWRSHSEWIWRLKLFSFTRSHIILWWTSWRSPPPPPPPLQSFLSVPWCTWASCCSWQVNVIHWVCSRLVS